MIHDEYAYVTVCYYIM